METRGIVQTLEKQGATIDDWDGIIVAHEDTPDRETRIARIARVRQGGDAFAVNRCPHCKRARDNWPPVAVIFDGADAMVVFRGGLVSTVRGGRS